MKYLAIIFGIIGLIFMLLSIKSSEKHKILKYLKLKALFYGIQYLILNATSGFVSMILAIIRIDIIEYKEKDKKNHNLLFLILLLIYMIYPFLTYTNYLDIFPAVGNIFYLFTLWFFKDIGIKVGTLVTVTIWLFYNILVGAYIPAISDIIIIFSTISYLKNYNVNKKGGITN